MKQMIFHKPVLLKQSVNGLSIKSDGVYVDVTYGGGSHSKEILKKLSLKGRLIAFDQDDDTKLNISSKNNFLFISSNFRYLKKFLKVNQIYKVDGVLADFGVSSHQLNSKDRGFSTRFDGPLDMRMDQNQNFSAKDIINEYSEDKLIKLFKNYGELKNAKQLATIIGVRRSVAPINSTEQLKSIFLNIIPKKYTNKILAKIFQAIRIEVNKELDAIKLFLNQASEVIAPGGRLVCISYHSLEDRLVKRFIRDGDFDGNVDTDFFGNKHLPFKKIGPVQIPSSVEIITNNRSRSAKLRIAEKL